MGRYRFYGELDGVTPSVVVHVTGTTNTIVSNAVSAENAAARAGYKISWATRRVREWEGIARLRSARKRKQKRK